MRADVRVADRLDRLARDAAAASSRALVGAAPRDGASSISFWWRRWIEHSRSPRCDDVAVLVAERPGPRCGAAARRTARGRRRGCRTPACASAARRRPAAPSSFSLLADDLHAAAAAAGRRLDDHREADRARPPRSACVVVVEHAGARQHRHAGLRHRRARARPCRPSGASPRAAGRSSVRPALACSTSAKSAFSERKP